MLRSSILLLVVISALASAADDDMTINVSVIGNELDTNQKASGELYEKADDLCSSIKCGLGEQCVINENEAVCQCSDSCEIPNDERQMVCSSSNKTYQSDCHFLREKCWCGRKDSRCTDLSVLNEKLDYYGQCKDIEECTLEQRKVFPVRMKIWLDEVLHILNKRNDLDSKYFNLVKLADEMKSNNAEKYWTAGVAFEFCQLDKSQDHQIQKEELGSLISSIKALENCIQPFLDECDTDGNDLISDAEWGKCLDLSDNDLVILRKNC